MSNKKIMLARKLFHYINTCRTGNYQNENKKIFFKESSTIFMELLRVNEDLNSVFNRFERFKKSRPKPLDHDDAPLPADPCPTGLLVSFLFATQNFGRIESHYSLLFFIYKMFSPPNLISKLKRLF